MISVKELYKSFEGQGVLENINIDICKGELAVLMGPSGAGKSTLIRCLNGLETFDHGHIKIGEAQLKKQNKEKKVNEDYQKQVQALRAQVGMVFQSFNLFPHLTVLENISKAPMVVKGLSLEEARSIALTLLKKVGLESKANQYPCQISGGQQQRAAIARALAMSPQVLLYDEPTSALDPSLTHEVLQVMKDLKAEGMTQVVVTHEMNFAKEAADQVYYLEDSQIVEVAPPSEIFASPCDARTRYFLRQHLTPSTGLS